MAILFWGDCGALYTLYSNALGGANFVGKLQEPFHEGQNSVTL
ncbi:hypothetical protein [Bartonella florencae]|nr:hypothetical protein [Bartonella florencae]